MPRSKTKLFKNDDHFYMKGKDLLEYIDRFAKAVKPTQSELLSMLFTYKAAWYAITGEELTAESQAVVGSENLEETADILRSKGSEKYARMAYVNKRPLNIATDLDYSTFLYDHLDELAAEENGLPIKPGTKEALELMISSRSNSKTCADYIAFDKPAKRTTEPLRLTNEDKSTYEYQAGPEHWKTFTAFSECMRRTGYKPLDDAAEANAKEDPINVCLMKNKQVTERLEKGDYKGVKDAYRKTKASFTFLDKTTLKEAQSNARFILDNMAERDCEYAETEEYLKLRDTLADFCDAKDLDTAAQKSAEVLLAAEKFTKGRKSSWFKSDEDKSCVNDALNAIATAVPDGPNNPSVRPLIDRFNNVRWWRRQDPVFMIDYHQPSAISRYQTVSLNPPAKPGEVMAPAHLDLKLQVDSNDIRHELYGAADEDEKSEISDRRDAGFYNRFDTDKEDSPLINKDEQLNDVQTTLYGDEKPDLGKEYEDKKKKSGEPIKLINARDRMLPLMKGLANMAPEKVNAIGEARFAEGLANLIALHITPPYSNHTDYINKLKLDENVNKYKSDPALMQLASDYKSDPKVMEDFKKAAGDCLKSENPVVDFAKFISDKYTEKKIALENQNKIVPQPEGPVAGI